MKKVNMIGELIGLIKLIKMCRNWYKCFFDYFRFYLGVPKGDFVIYVLRSGVKLRGISKSSKTSSDLGTIREIWVNREYNPNGFDIKNGYSVIDIGAHKGYFSVFAGLQAKDVFVYSFEPFSNNYNFLVDNIKLNDLQNRVKVFNIGISGYKSKKRLYISKEDMGGHSIYRKGGEFVEIDCITLKDILRMNKIEKCDFLKLDCEGAEYEILFNTSENTLNKISKISLEYHEVSQYNYKDLEKFLKEKGFEVKSTSKCIYASKAS